MTIYYLMVKTHNITGLKYLCQTKRQDPIKYLGSGTRWRNHLRKHGKEISTEILLECGSKDELRKWGIHYSELWNVAQSNEWANLKPESGDGFSSGKDNPRFDSTIYCWEHIQTGEVVYMTQRYFIEKLSMSQTQISMLINNVCKSCAGWHIKGRRLNDNKGGDNYQHDDTVYKWKHSITGEILQLNRYDFTDTCNITHLGNLSSVISGNRRSINKWQLIL